jgi:putative ABC transport system substrate-binding protein
VVGNGLSLRLGGGHEATRFPDRAWRYRPSGESKRTAAATGYRFPAPRGTPPPSLKAAFRKGLVEVGISDGLDIRIEDRAANGEYDQLPALAADLVNRQVAFIAAELLPAALAAKAATQSIPIVFFSGSDPIKSGLVSSITRPTSNVTGIAVMFTRLGAKNLELLRELVPQATVIAALANPINPNAEPQLNDLQVAARPLGLQLVTLGASNDAELDSVLPSR